MFRFSKKYILWFLFLFILHSTNSIAQSVVLDSSDIPVFSIDTKGFEIIDEPKIEANLKIIDNGAGKNNRLNDMPVFEGKIGIELRGSYSQRLPQKPYGFETLDENGDEINVSLLGFPEENDWILLANYNDKSFVRNSLIFDLFNRMGHYAPRALHCEVVVNNEYQGIYVFTEKIKRDKNRVNIPKLDSDDNAGDSITGGYIFKTDYSDGNDYWTSSYWPDGYQKNSVRFIYTYPEPDEITAQQKNYIRNYVDQFEDALYSSNYADSELGYRSYIDVNSFVDYFIIGEVTRNVDAYKKSCHYFKQIDSKGGLISAGPVWDFDWAMKNFNECIYSNTDGSGWAYKIHECYPNPVPPDWMSRLLSDSYFRNNVYERYFQLRQNILSEAGIYSYIDSVASYLGEAQKRHYQKWPILGKNVGTPEVDYIPQSFKGEIEKLKDWFTVRLAWLDNNMPGEPTENYWICEGEKYISFFPNPVRDVLFVESDETIKSIDILNTYGQLVETYKCNSLRWEKNLFALESNIYFLKITTTKNETNVLKIVKL